MAKIPRVTGINQDLKELKQIAQKLPLQVAQYYLGTSQHDNHTILSLNKGMALSGDCRKTAEKYFVFINHGDFHLFRMIFPIRKSVGCDTHVINLSCV